MLIEILKFFVYSILIVLISKYILVKALRKVAENLKLKPRYVGNIAGIATSIPELLTVTVSSFKGLVGTSVYNIISSNIINFIQYVISLIVNKNYREIKNIGIIIQNILVILTIIFPIMLLKIKNQFHIILSIILIAMYIVFSLISKKAHEKYLKNEEKEIEKNNINEKVIGIKNNKKTYVYVLYIFVSGCLLYFIGNSLGNVLEELSKIFGISELILGGLLGFVTSIPELVTFFEAQKHYKNDKDKSLLGVVEATNNLLTSNMLNLFIIQAIGIWIYIVFYSINS